MDIFMIISVIICVALLVSSIVFWRLSWHLWDKMSVKSDNYYYVLSSHELYGKYKKYKKLSKITEVLYVVIATFLLVVVLILRLTGRI